MVHPIILVTRLDPDAIYRYESLRRQLERQGIDDEPSGCVQLATSPAAEAQFMANMSRGQQVWEVDMGRIEIGGLDVDPAW